MSLDVSRLLDDPDFCTTFVVERCGESVNDRGRSELTVETLGWQGVIQPATPRELERLPEGDRDRESITVYSETPLRIGQRPEGEAADIIHWRGMRFEVASVETWQGYTRAIALLLPEGPDA